MSYSDLILESSPRYYFRFDNGTVQNVGADTSITIDVGANTGFPTTGGILNSGKATTANYDNTNYGFTVQQSTTYISDRIFTISGWFKVAAADMSSSNIHHILRTAVNTTQGIYLAKGGGNLYLTAFIGGATSSVSSGILAWDTWHHFAVTNDQTDLKLYINGSLYATVTSGTTTPADGTQYWFRYTGSTNRYGVHGQFDELALFNSTLSDTTIASHYNYVNGASVSASPSTASSLFVHPTISAQKNVSLSADASTASALTPDHQVSNFDRPSMLDSYMQTLSLEQWYKFDTFKKIKNYGSGGGSDTAWIFNGNSTTNVEKGVQGSGYLDMTGAAANGAVIAAFGATESIDPEILDGNYALGFWVRADANPAENAYIFSAADFSGGSFGLKFGTLGLIKFWIGSSGGEYTVTTDTDVADGEWHLVVATLENKNMKIYVDGTLEDSNTYVGDLPGGLFVSFGNNQSIASQTTRINLSHFFIAGQSVITTTVMNNMISAENVPVQANTRMVDPSVKFTNKYNELVETYTPLIDLRFDEASGAPANYGSGGALSINKYGTNVTYLTPTINRYAYKFTNVNTYIAGDYTFASGTFSTNQRQSMAIRFRCDTAPGNDQVLASMGMFGFLGAGITLTLKNSTGYLELMINQGFGGNDTEAITYQTNLVDSKWHHVVAVKDGSNLTLYVDGISRVTKTDAAIGLSDAATWGVASEAKWYGTSAASKELYIDEFSVFSNGFTAAQVLELYQSLEVDAMTASSEFITPVGSAGFGPTIHPGVMYASALLVDPTQQDEIFILPVPATAFIDTVTPNFGTTSNADISASPMTASGLFHDPQYNIGDEHSASSMDASATFVHPQLLIPGFWFANPMIANPVLMVQPGVVTTQGGLVLAQTMTATGSFVLPPAYKSLFDDKWYDLLYSQHSIRHGVTFENGGNGEAILKLFDDVTTDKAPGSTIPNNLTQTITTDGTVEGNTAPAMKVVAEFTPTTNAPLLGIGYFDDYERKSVRFNNITTGYENSEYSNTAFSFELSIKTTKANQIIAFGKTRSFYGYQQYTTSYGLSDGKLFLKSTAAIGPAPTSHYKETNAGTVFIGNKNIADGQWHHIVIQNGWDDNRVQFWIDGELDKQKIGGFRLDGPSFLGFNSQVSTYASDFQTSAWSYDSHAFPRELEIDNHRYAYIKYEPVRAEPMIASATSGDHLATSNRARALMLYWWPTDSFQNPPLTTKQFNTSGFPDIETWAGELTTADFIKSGPQDYYGWDVFPVDITGYFVSDLVKPAAYGGQQNIKVGSKPFIGTGQNYNTNPEYLYNAEGSFKDPITDARRYIDVVNDIDLRNFDAIFFKNFPDDTKEKESYTTYEDVDTYFGSKEVELYDAFIKSLRAAVDTGLSLYVTNPQLAIDLGVVDRIETVPDMDELSGFDSDPYTPTIVPSNATALSLDNAAKWADTYKNNRLRVVNTLEGFTTEPSFIRSDRAYYYNDDANSFGAPNRPFTKFIYRPNGLQVGDEFIISNDPQNVLGQSNARSYLATPFENVKSGTIITAFANTVKRGTATITNPYANYATCIVVKPGDALKGTQCGGKIVVNFTENLNGAYDNGDVDLVSDYWINIAYNDGFITEAEKNTYLAASYNIDRQLANNIITQAEYNKLSFWSSNGMYIISDATLIDDPADSRPKDGIGKGARSSIVTKTRKSGTAYSAKVTTESQWFSFAYAWLYPRMGIKVPNILTRGFWWLSNRESYDGTVERPLVATALAVFVDPAVAGQKDRVLNASAMISSATITQAVGTSAADINIAPVPFQATALINNYVTRYTASPMTASAVLRTNNRIFTTAVDEVVVYVMHTDPILYIREDVIK